RGEGPHLRQRLLRHPERLLDSAGAVGADADDGVRLEAARERQQEQEGEEGAAHGSLGAGNRMRGALISATARMVGRTLVVSAPLTRLRPMSRSLRVGVLTGGGDCPGLNAVIRAVTKSLILRDGAEVLGFEDGFEGLVERRVRPLSYRDVSGILTHGGTIL